MINSRGCFYLNHPSLIHKYGDFQPPVILLMIFCVMVKWTEVISPSLKCQKGSSQVILILPTILLCMSI